ncbi:MAG: 50S ribosomal protein L10 [Planctomycetes bacterium]|nr:50S ribosomal protein L10 [Planctomycetota bacterium]
MSKVVKTMIMREYKARIAKGTDQWPDAMVISIRGVKAVDTTKMRHTLAKKNIRVTVVQNALARKSFEGTSLAGLSDMLTGGNALAYGGNSVVEVAREVVAIVEKMPGVELKGAILDGTVFKGKAGVLELSKFPTREEAIGRVVTLIVSPARKIMGQVKGPGSKVAGIIKAIEEKLEKGEAIAKVA